MTVQHLNLTLLAFMVVAVTGCSLFMIPLVDDKPRLASSSLVDQASKTARLDERAVVIGESSYLALMNKRWGQVPSEELRRAAARTAATLGDPNTLGVVATYRDKPTRVKSDLFIVVRDAALSPTGQLEGRDVFVAAVRLAGVVPWVGTEARLAAHKKGQSIGTCESRVRGCRLLHQSVKGGPRSVLSNFSTHAPPRLSAETLVNMESGGGPPNASGFKPELVLGGLSALGQETNTFECHEPVEWEACDAPMVSRDQRLEEGPKTLPFPKSGVIISEYDFLSAMRKGDYTPATEIDMPNTREFLTAANSENLTGVSGIAEHRKPFAGNLFAVARNPILWPDGKVTAKDFYFAAVQLSGTARWIGRNPELTFRGAIPTIRDSLCGLVTAPTDFPNCGGGPCWLLKPPSLGGQPTISAADNNKQIPFLSIPIKGFNAMHGLERWPANSRVTLRFPTQIFGYGRSTDMFALACTQLWTPPPLAKGEELCNGLDDNQNGDVDESGACATRDTSCACVPVTCSEVGQTCGTIPNGCGQNIVCGPACP